MKPLFVQVLLIARQMGVLKLGQVALDGSKVHANASRHSALSWGHANQIEAHLKAEVAELMRLAEEADRAEVPDGMDVPEELKRRQERLLAMAKAKAEIEARAAKREAEEQAEHEAKCKAREEQRAAGKKPRGPEPKPPHSGPRESDQVNLTDADSRIMKAPGGGFEQS